MKLQELKEKSIDELNALIVDTKKQLLDLRMQKSLQKLENTAQIRQLKTVVAQAKTLIKEKSEVK
ncbi:MAG: 50S ribosomal protein L29 [Candidatus Gastranaerophilaceae bacterium]|jgi:ribosomal protein L29|nr:50S ribosomal protein L29 [Clostridium sp.]CDC18347.1 50S ribosomal protein L29 [Clostridium sp. CAG:306]DAB27195.1 MAG TPA: 50S ribosomal protein L29 [Candidatus Gastranaerophilales bacterium HUM_21]